MTPIFRTNEKNTRKEVRNDVPSSDEVGRMVTFHGSTYRKALHTTAKRFTLLAR